MKYEANWGENKDELREERAGLCMLVRGLKWAEVGAFERT
jgi:hypothetical protein